MERVVKNDGLKRFVSLIDEYFASGGAQMQGYLACCPEKSAGICRPACTCGRIQRVFYTAVKGCPAGYYRKNGRKTIGKFVQKNGRKKR